MIDTNRPRVTSKETPSRTRSTTGPCRYSLTRSRAASAMTPSAVISSLPSRPARTVHTRACAHQLIRGNRLRTLPAHVDLSVEVTHAGGEAFVAVVPEGGGGRTHV